MTNEYIKTGDMGTTSVRETTEGAPNARETSKNFGRWNPIEEKYHKPNSAPTNL